MILIYFIIISMYVCVCKLVTEKQIQSSIQQGACSIKDLQYDLGVATQCGKCASCAKQMLKQVQQKPAEEPSNETLPIASPAYA